MLSSKDIKEALINGKVTICPYNPENLGQNSYDVNLGTHYWKLSSPISHHCLEIIKSAMTSKKNRGESTKVLKRFGHFLGYINPSSGNMLPAVDPYNEDIYLMWTLMSPMSFDNYHDKEILKSRLSQKSYDFHKKKESKIILVKKKDHLLCHTTQFIGSVEDVCPMMGSRSSTRRIGLDTCRDAGKGDIGYRNRWTLEVTNTTSDQDIIMVSGQRYSQVTFFSCLTKIPEENYYGNYDHDVGSGKYQKNTLHNTPNTNDTALNIKNLASSWNIFNLIPKKICDTVPTNENSSSTTSSYPNMDEGYDIDEIVTLVYFLSQFLLVETEHVKNDSNPKPENINVTTKQQSEEIKFNHQNWSLTKVLNYARSLVTKEPNDNNHKEDKEIDVESGDVSTSNTTKGQKNKNNTVSMSRYMNDIYHAYETGKFLTKLTDNDTNFYQKSPTKLDTKMFYKESTNSHQICDILDTYTEFCYLCTISLYDDINFSIYDVYRQCSDVNKGNMIQKIYKSEETNNDEYNNEINDNENKTEGDEVTGDHVVECDKQTFFSDKDTFVIKSTSNYRMLMRRNEPHGWDIDNQNIYRNSFNESEIHPLDNSSNLDGNKHNGKENDRNYDGDDHNYDDNNNNYNLNDNSESDNSESSEDNEKYGVPYVTNVYDPDNLRNLHSEPLEMFLSWKSRVILSCYSITRSENVSDDVYDNLVQKINNLKFFYKNMTQQNNDFGVKLLGMFNSIEVILNHILKKNTTSETLSNVEYIMSKISDKNFSIIDHIKNTMTKKFDNRAQMTIMCIYVYLTTNFVKHVSFASE